MNVIRGGRNITTYHRIIQCKFLTLHVLKSNETSKNKQTVFKFLG